MKKILLLLLLFAIVLPAKAEDDSLSWYIGVHGNKTSSKMWDKKYVFGNDTLERIDNGDSGTYSFSITCGFEIESQSSLKLLIDMLLNNTDNFKIVVGGELFFDYINKTLVQGDKSLWLSEWGFIIEPRPMANKPIFKNKYLAGTRVKAGIRLFRCFDIYGHAGLAYWQRDWYLDRERVYGSYTEDPNWKIMPIYGLGGTIHITDNWAANINYTRIRQNLDIGLDKNGDDYCYAAPKIGIDILTIGVVYYF